MATWTDPDTTAASTEAAKTGQAAKAGDVAGQVKATSSVLDQATSGDGPDSFGATAAEARGALASVATDAAVIPTIAAAAKKAWDQFTRDAPSAADMNAAEKKVQDAKTAMDSAKAAPGADTPGTDADKTALDAAKAYDDACDELRKIKAKRKLARDTLWADLRRALQIAKRIQVDGGTGYGKPGSTSDGGTGYGKPGTTNAPGWHPGPTPKSPGTTAGSTPPATPAPKAEAPGAGKTGSSTPDATSQALAALALQGKGQQSMPTMPQTPAATAPQQAQQPQQEKKDEKPETKKALDYKDLEDLRDGKHPSAILASIGGPLSSGAPLSSSAPTQTTGQQSAPSGKYGYTPRTGVQPLGATGIGALNATGHQAPTAGTSAQNLTTASDTSGRPEGQARTAINDGLKTTTSAATNTAAEQQAQQQNQRAAGLPAGGVPHAMGPGVSGAAQAPRTRDKDDLVHSSGAGPDGNRLDQGQTAIGEAVPGGTICQNRPDTTGKAA